MTRIVIPNECEESFPSIFILCGRVQLMNHFVARYFLFFFFIQLSNHFGGDAPVDDVIGLDVAGFLLGAPQCRLDEIHDSFVGRPAGIAK